ncbi:hypothetical protein ACFL5G_05920, partial [Candidatus Margulisiibacteriota bacterium]
GSLQKWIPSMRMLKTKDIYLLSSKQLKYLVDHGVFDYLLENSDSHFGNFLINNKNEVVGIDKTNLFRSKALRGHDPFAFIKILSLTSKEPLYKKINASNYTEQLIRKLKDTPARNINSIFRKLEKDLDELSSSIEQKEPISTYILSLNKKGALQYKILSEKQEKMLLKNLKTYTITCNKRFINNIKEVDLKTLGWPY